MMQADSHDRLIPFLGRLDHTIPEWIHAGKLASHCDPLDPSVVRSHIDSYPHGDDGQSGPSLLQALQARVCSALSSRLRGRIDAELARALAVTLCQHLVLPWRPFSSAHRSTAGIRVSGTDAPTQYLSDLRMLETLQEAGLLEHVLLPQIIRLCSGSTALRWAAGQETEIRRFVAFLHAISTRTPRQEIPLLFRGPSLKVAVMLVARQGKMEREGIAPYLRSIRKSLAKGAESLYLLGLGAAHVASVGWVADEAMARGLVQRVRTQEVRLTGEKAHLKCGGIVEARAPVSVLEQRGRSRERLEKALAKHIPEIRHGRIEIAGVARTPGCGAKVAVRFRDDIRPSWLAVETCRGKDASRLQEIRRDLGTGEWVRILPWTSEFSRYVVTALFRETCQRRSVRRVDLDPSWSAANVLVGEQAAAALAVGSNGIDIDLTSHLTGAEVQLAVADSSR